MPPPSPPSGGRLPYKKKHGAPLEILKTTPKNYFEFRQKYSAARHKLFSTLFSVFGYPDETLSLVFDILQEHLGFEMPNSINVSFRAQIHQLKGCVGKDCKSHQIGFKILLANCFLLPSMNKENSM